MRNEKENTPIEKARNYGQRLGWLLVDYKKGIISEAMIEKYGECYSQYIDYLTSDLDPLGASYVYLAFASNLAMTVKLNVINQVPKFNTGGTMHGKPKSMFNIKTGEEMVFMQ